MKICLYGAGSRKIDKIYLDETYKLGCELALRNHTLVFGGGDTGVMGACVKGVHDNNGTSLGIAPPWIDDFEALCKECSDFIYVDTMDERKNEFVKQSDAFIIAPGGIGTLDEFFEIITLKKLKKHSKPIIIFNINHYYDKMFEMLEEMDSKGFLYKQEELYKVADNVDDIFRYLQVTL